MRPWRCRWRRHQGTVRRPGPTRNRSPDCRPGAGPGEPAIFPPIRSAAPMPTAQAVCDDDLVPEEPGGIHDGHAGGCLSGARGIRKRCRAGSRPAGRRSRTDPAPAPIRTAGCTQAPSRGSTPGVRTVPGGGGAPPRCGLHRPRRASIHVSRYGIVRSASAPASQAVPTVHEPFAWSRQAGPGHEPSAAPRRRRAMSDPSIG